MLQPLIEILKGIEKGKKSGTFLLTPEALVAFYNLKKRFTEALILYYFNLLRRIIVETDASKFAIGGILL